MNARFLAALAIGSTPWLFAQDRAPVFRGGTDVVTLDVVVQEGKVPVIGLKDTDFDVRDNGVQQVVTSVTYGQLPLDLRLLFDTSGSISDAQLQSYLSAMAEVTRALRPDDRCDIISFSARMVDAAALQAPPVRIDLQRAQPNATSFFDAVSLSLVTASVPGRRQLTLVMSDADDNASFFDNAMLTEVAKRTDAVVYPIKPAVDARRTLGWKEPMLKDRLSTLAAITGGRVITADRNVGPALLSALDEFRRSYVVSYTATGVASAGWHDVTVAVHGVKPYTVRARQGYRGTGLF
jgi:VWFA-related protein